MTILSVIVPVHNTASYLRKCVESIRNQTLKDIEIILVENLSTDGSSEICDEYAQIDSRIKVLHLNIADLGTARNEGIKAASSPYLGFVDSDDYIDPEMYASMLRFLRQHRAGMAYCNLKYISENGDLLEPVSDTGQIRAIAGRDALKDVFRGKLDSSFCSKLFQRELFATHSFPEGFFFEDHTLIYRIVHQCRTVVHVDRPFYHYVQHNDSITYKWSFKKYYHHFLADYGRLEFIRQEAVFDGEEQQQVLSRFVNTCLTLFRYAQLFADKTDRRESVPVMKKKLKALLPAKNEMNSNSYRRLNKMIYLAPFVLLFYRLRYRIRGGKAEHPFVNFAK